MNNRRDQQHGHEEYGDRTDLRGGRGGDDWRSDNARSGWGPNGGEARFGGNHTPVGREGYGGNWRTEGLGPQLGGYPNEPLANDFSLEGTRPLVSHRGKGPKNFKRSDERIKELVSEALTDHHGIDASELEVSVKDGEVTLAGTVLGRRLKRLAEDIVASVSGVVDVHNTIRIQKTTGTDQGLGRDLPTDARQNMAAPRSQH